MTRDKLLLLDFDGTLCLGEDPILGYATQVDATLRARGLPGPGGRGITEVVAQALSTNELLVSEIQFPDMAGTDDRASARVPDVRGPDDAGIPLGAVTPARSAGANPAHPQSWPLQDGYQLVQLLAAQSGLSLEETGQAFVASRRILLAAGLENTDLHAPEGAAELLGQVREAAGGVVLITNAPTEGFGTWLSALGLQDSFDAVVNSAQKPAGMPQAVTRAGESIGLSVPADRLLAVGDIWANDCAHVQQIGGKTVLIDRFSTGLGEPDHRVRDFDAAVPIIRQWADAHAG